MNLTIKEFKQLAWIINANLGTPEETAAFDYEPKTEAAEPEMVTEDNYKKVFAGLGYIPSSRSSVFWKNKCGLSLDPYGGIWFWQKNNDEEEGKMALNLFKELATIQIVTLLAKQLQKL